MNKLNNILKKPRQMLDNPTQSAILGGIVLSLILLLIFLSGYYFTKLDSSNKNVSRILGELNRGPDEPTENELSKVYSRYGTVSKVKDNNIFFVSRYKRDNYYIESTLKAELNEGTILLKKDLYLLYKKGPDFFNATDNEAINLNEINIGDNVMVYSKQDIKYRTEFNASNVEVFYKSQEY